jgi:hypothetical protein
VRALKPADGFKKTKTLFYYIQIVWDPVAKKWMNKEEEDGGATPLAPPPKISDISSFHQSPTSISQNPMSNPVVVSSAEETLGLNGSKLITGGGPASGAAAAAVAAAAVTAAASAGSGGGGNIYKLSRSRNMRANYVDVMNAGGSKTNSPAVMPPVLTVPTPAGSPTMPIAASSPQLFMPAAGNYLAD